MKSWRWTVGGVREIDVSPGCGDFHNQPIMVPEAERSGGAKVLGHLYSFNQRAFSPQRTRSSDTEDTEFDPLRRRWRSSCQHFRGRLPIAPRRTASVGWL